MNYFSERLRILRQERNWSMRELGEKISAISGSTFTIASISNWETKGAEPPYNVLRLLATLFNVSSDYLIGISDTPHFNNEKESAHNTKNVITKPKVTIEQNEKLYFVIQNHIQYQQNYIDEIQKIHNDLLSLPFEMRNRFEQSLTEYVKFFNFKYESSYNEFTQFTTYIKREMQIPQK
ncbi:helix-turn-helix domain-containing protein [Bacillus mycoides]|uniref:helix-turn-helix domain-containing protein n=1 Tax=Bacillus mycoides TaxID=1405 RepID=UPI003CFEB1DF